MEFLMVRRAHSMLMGVEIAVCRVAPLGVTATSAIRSLRGTFPVTLPLPLYFSQA